MPRGDTQLQSRAGANAPDKPQLFLNGSHGASKAVAIDQVSGDQVIIPSPPPGVTRMLYNQGGGMGFSLGNVLELTPSLSGFALLQDAQGNETAIAGMVSAAGAPLPATVTVANTFLTLKEGEQVVFRPDVTTPIGAGIFVGCWVDTDMLSTRVSVDATLRVIAAPGPGKTLSLPIMLPAMGPAYGGAAFYNYDAVAGHLVDLYFNDGTTDIPFETAVAVAAFTPEVPPVPGPYAPPLAGEALSTSISMVALNLVIPDGCSLKAIVTDPPLAGEVIFKAPFVEYNAAKSAY